MRRIPGFASVAVLTFAMLYAPIGILVVYSFNAGESLAIWEGFSLEWYERAWHNEAVQEATLRSLGVASVAATVATIAATMARARDHPHPAVPRNDRDLRADQPAAHGARGGDRGALLIFFAIIKVATGYTGIVYLVAAHTAFCIPFAYLPIRARLESMDLSLERAAADLYATPWLAFRRVTLPLMWPGVMAGFMLAFVISLDDVVITEFVKSAGQETLPTYMLGQIRRIMTPEVNAISTVLLLAGVVFVTLFFALSRKR